jgi:hypothetical protein
MLTVEERAELVVKFEAVARLSKNLAGGGLDHALRVLIQRETVQREFYVALNSCTNWDVNA